MNPGEYYYCDEGPYDGPLGRWFGGLAHELGHTFGLPHPPGCDEGQAACDRSALMGDGYSSYPNTYLRDDEKSVLRRSAVLRNELNLLKTRVGRGLGQFDVAATEKQHRDELGGGRAASVSPSARSTQSVAPRGCPVGGPVLSVGNQHGIGACARWAVGQCRPTQYPGRRFRFMTARMRNSRPATV